MVRRSAPDSSRVGVARTLAAFVLETSFGATSRPVNQTFTTGGDSEKSRVATSRSGNSAAIVEVAE